MSETEETAGLTRRALRALVTDRLKVALPVLGGRVHSSRAWPQAVQDIPAEPAARKFPCACITADKVRRQSKGNGSAPAYAATVTVQMIFRSVRRLEAEVEAELDALVEAAEMALLQDPEFMRAGFEDIDTTTSTRELANSGSDLVMGQDILEWDFILTEEFPPILVDRLERIRLVLDAIDPFSPQSDFDPMPPFPDAAPAPRERGPDGRPEVELDIPISQT